jgi:hypothetical protein
MNDKDFIASLQRDNERLWEALDLSKENERLREIIKILREGLQTIIADGSDVTASGIAEHVLEETVI